MKYEAGKRDMGGRGKSGIKGERMDRDGCMEGGKEAGGGQIMCTLG